ncbi:endosialidase-like protein [Sphingobacterium alimentarium]|uniref:Endosialidase-like protein n=1 Tax=Sphingobacterium alimentarium TaxID=797292 RepID=A0A4R3VV95_9SPHI|nr:endosialidase-like protein [Sphingobacterium alimentarium]
MKIKSFVIIGAIMGFVYTANAQQRVDEKELKVNIETISEPINIINNLKPVTFNFNTDKYKAFELPKSKQYGFVIENTNTEIVDKKSKIYKTGKNATGTYQTEEVNNEKLIIIRAVSIWNSQVLPPRTKRHLADK